MLQKIKKDLRNIINSIIFFKQFNLLLYISFLLLLFALLFIFKLPYLPYLIFYLLGFGWSLYFFGRRLKLIEIVMISPIIFFTLFTSLLSLISMFGISLSVIIFYIFVILSIILFVKKDIFNSRNINGEVSRSDILILFLLISALIAKLQSIISMTVPNLSDTLTHAYYARLIVETNDISFFYSPGLHIISAYSVMLGSYNIPLQILYVTNFFSAYAGLMMYYFVRNSFKNKIAALFSALFISLGSGISLFFYSGGKNALVIAISILFLFMYVVSIKNKMNQVRFNLLSAILLFSIFITHYPTAIFGCIYWFSMFIVDWKNNFKRYLIIFLGVIFGFTYLLTMSCATSEQSYTSSTQASPRISITSDFVGGVVSFIKSIFSISSTNVFPGVHLVVYFILAIGILYFIFELLHSKKCKSWLNFSIWVVGCFLCALTIQLFSIKDLMIVVETYLLSIFIFLYIFLGFGIAFFYKIIKKLLGKYSFFILTVIFTIVSTLSAKSIYDTYAHFAPLQSVVFEGDLKLFDWIDNNTEDSDGIITNGFFASSTLVGPSDAGGWIPIFTGNYISTPFWEFSHDSTIANLNNYIELQKDLSNCEVINYYLQNGFKYYYQGAVPIRDVLGSPQELIDNGWDLVYSENGAYLFAIPTTTCK